MSKQTSTERREILRLVSSALREQGYDPVKQLRGYLLSDDPTYIPDYRGARVAIAALDRADLLDELLSAYLIDPDEASKNA